MESFPWMKSVYQAFSKTFPAEYNSRALNLLNKHLEEEYKQALNTDNDRLKELYSCLRNLYNHFCWKINWNKESRDMKICCVKILSYLIKSGIILSKGKPTSKWINHVLAAMRLFPGEFDLLCDALLLVQKLKTSCHKAFAVILKHFLCTNQIKIEEPAVYFKTLLLIRRLQFLTPDKSEKTKLVSFAIRTHCPENALPWLIVQGIHHLPKSNNKNLSKKLLSKKLSSKFIKQLREVLLSGVENDTENVIVHNESFTVDSEIIIENDPVNNAGIRMETKQMPTKRSSKKISHSMTDQFIINDIECNSFLPKKKRKKSSDVLPQESLHQFENSVLADITQNEESSLVTGISFENERFMSRSQKKGKRKHKIQRKSIRNVKDYNSESVQKTLVSTRKCKKLTNRKSESIEISSEENDTVNSSNIILCPEQLFVIDNAPVSDHETATKILSNDTLHNEVLSEKHSSPRKSSSELHCLSMSANLTLVKENQLNVNDSSDEDSYEILKSSNNLKGDCFVDQTEQQASCNISKILNVDVENSEKEISSLSTNVSVLEDAILDSQTKCDTEMTKDSRFEKIVEQQFSKPTVLNDENYLNHSFSSSPSRTFQTELQSATKIVSSNSNSLDSFKKCEENFIFDADSLKENLESDENKVLESSKVSSLPTNISVQEDEAILDNQTRFDTEITEDSRFEKTGEEHLLSKPIILNDENHLNNSLLSSSNRTSQTELQPATKTVSSSSDSLDSPKKCEENFTSDTNSLKGNLESDRNKVLESVEVSSLPTSISVQEEYDVILGKQTICDTEISEDSSFEMIGEEQQFSKSIILNDENHLNNSFSSSSSRTSQSELQSATKTVSTNSDSLDSSNKCEESFTSDTNSLKGNLESNRNKFIESAEVSSYPTSVSVQEDDGILDNQTRCDTEMTEDSSFENIGEEQQFSKSAILNDENHLNNCFSTSSSRTSQTEPQFATKTVSSNSDSLDSSKKGGEKFTSDTYSLKGDFKSEGNKILNSDELNTSEKKISEDSLRELLSDMSEAISTVHEKFERTLNMDPELLHKMDVIQNTPLSYHIDDMVALITPSDISLLNDKSADNVPSEIQNLTVMDSSSNENIDIICKDDNEQSGIEHHLNKSLHRSGMESKDNILSEQQLIHSKSSIVNNVTENQPVHQLFLDGSETTKNEKKGSHDVLDSYIKNVLNKMVDKVANKMDGVLEVSSFEVLKENILKEGLTPLKFSPICKFPNTLTNYDAESLKIEGISLDKIKTCLSFSDISSKHLEKLESDSSCMLNKLPDKDFCIYRDKLQELKDNMSDSALSSLASIEHESENNFQDNHSCTDSETESDDDIVHSKQCADILDGENDLSSSLPIAEKDSVVTENSDNQCTLFLDQNVAKSENSSIINAKMSDIEKQFCKVDQPLPQDVTIIKTFPLEEVEQFTLSQPTVIVNLGKRCDSKDAVISKLTAEGQTKSCDIEVKEDTSSVFEEIDDTLPKIIKSQIISTEIECAHTCTEETIDEATLKGLFVHQNSHEDSCHSKNNEFKKCSKNQSRNASYSSQPGDCQIDLPQNKTTETSSVAETVEKESGIKSSVDEKEIPMKLDSIETPEIVLPVNKTTASLIFSEVLEKQPNVKLPIELKEVSVLLDSGEVRENILVPEISKNSSGPSSRSSRMNLRKRQTDLTVSEGSAKESSEKSQFEIKEVSIELDPMEVSKIVSSNDNSNLIPSLSEILETKSNFKMSIDPKEVTKNTLVSKISEESSGPSRMNLRKRQVGNCQTDLSVSEASAKESSDKSSLEIKEISVQLYPMEISKIVSSVDNSNIIPSPSEVLEKESNFKTPIDPEEVTKSTVISKISEESAGSSRMNLRKRQTGNNQIDLSVSEAILCIPATETSEKRQNVKSEDLSLHLDSSEASKDVLVPNISEMSDKSTNINLRKHHSIQEKEKEILSRTPKSKKSVSLRSSKRLKSNAFNLTLSTDLSQLCLDSPTSKRSSRFKPLDEIERVQKENNQEQSVETKELKNNSSETDTIVTDDNSQESKSHNSYNLRARKSIIMPGKLKF